MNNKFIIRDISKKNNFPLHRNASLDSTKSSLRVKKIKLHNELSPFVKITKNPNIKNVLDFPICMSLFTNNYSINEKDKIKNNNLSNRIKFKYPNIKNDILNENKKNELLLLSKEKKIISRNPNVLNIHSFSPINSIVKSSILNPKLSSQSSRNISKPILKKIDYSPLINFTNQTNKDIKILQKYKYNQNNFSISNNTLEQEISTIKKKKNSSIIDLKYNISIKKNNKFKMPLQFFTSKDNGAKKENEKKISPNKIINKIQNEILFSEKNNIMKELNKTNKLMKIKFNQLENLNSKYESNMSLPKKEKNKSIILNKKKNNNKNHKISKINKKRDKINKSQYIDSKDKIDKNIRLFKRSPTKKKTLAITNKINEQKEGKYPSILMLEMEKLQRIKNNKFYLVINNKKTNDIYSKKEILNEYNKMITEKSINNSINTKIFLSKTEILVNFRESIKNATIKQETKLKSKETTPLSKEALEKILLIYNKNVYNNKKKIEQFKKVIISFKKIRFNYKMNCVLTYEERNFLFSTIEFGEVSLSPHKTKKNLRRQSFQNLSFQSNFIKTIKRKNTFSEENKIEFNELEDGFLLRKTKNNFKKDLKWRNNPTNLITIHDCILKSLYFYNEKHELNINYQNTNKKIYNIKKGKFVYKARDLSKKLVNNFSKQNSKMILKKFNKKNTANFDLRELENDIPYNKLNRRSTTIFNLDDLTRNLKKQLSQKSSDSSIENFSILKRKNFFKKTKIIKDNKKDSQRVINFRDTIRDSGEINKVKKNPEELNEDHINFDELYFELIKLIIEGKNKQFQKIFEEKRIFIDINQELFDGNTLLILSSREGNYYITKFLCEQNAEVNIQNTNGNTALHYAIGKQFYAIADILARYGAREDIKNIKGLAPWDYIENNIE